MIKRLFILVVLAGLFIPLDMEAGRKERKERREKRRKKTKEVLKEVGKKAGEGVDIIMKEGAKGRIL